MKLSSIALLAIAIPALAVTDTVVDEVVEAGEVNMLNVLEEPVGSTRGVRSLVSGYHME